jgi:hypothetical protein
MHSHRKTTFSIMLEEYIEKRIRNEVFPRLLECGLIELHDAGDEDLD